MSNLHCVVVREPERTAPRSAPVVHARRYAGEFARGMPCWSASTVMARSSPLNQFAHPLVAGGLGTTFMLRAHFRGGAFSCADGCGKACQQPESFFGGRAELGGVDQERRAGFSNEFKAFVGER